jgi:ATP phosphoribosyltransferase regulatory subunit
LVDREGDLLMLRSDMTLFLARHLGLNLRDTDVPSRVCYADSILRHENREDISRNEFFQAGAELVGVPGERGDLEILCLAQEAFSAIGFEDIRLHVGSRAALAACLAGPEEQSVTALTAAVALRDKDAIGELVDEAFREILVSILLFIGTPDEAAPLLDSARDMGITGSRLEALAYPCSLVSSAAAFLPPGNIVLDYSEVGGQPYYSGIVFRGYMDGVDTEVLSGGRYDRLLSHFGFDCPSTGFSILLRKVESLIMDDPQFDLPPIGKATGGSFAEALGNARFRRQNGEVVSL